MYTSCERGGVRLGRSSLNQSKSLYCLRNSNSLRYGDDTTPMAESQEALKSLLMRVKGESEKAGLKLNFQKMKIMASSLITSWPVSSVEFSHSVMSNSLHPHGLQHARPPCSSPTPRIYPNSCPLSWWCHPAISSSVFPFSSRLQSSPGSGSFQMNQFFTSGGQSTGVSASTSVLPVNTQDQSPLGWTGWISLQPKGLSKVFSNTTVQKHQFFGAQLSL